MTYVINHELCVCSLSTHLYNKTTSHGDLLTGYMFGLLHLEERPQKFGNRTRVEILDSILKVAANGSLKTHIMYKANLSHRQLEKYLTFLEEKGLLCEFEDEGTGTNMYKVTGKGIQFLKEYLHLSEYFGEETQ